MNSALLLSSAALPARRIAYQALGLFDRIFQRSVPAFVLCYHSAANDGSRFSMSTQAIEQHITWLCRHREPVALSEIVRYVRGEQSLPRPVFAVSFDDGFSSLLKLKHLPERYGVQPTVFALANPEHANRDELLSRESLLTPQQLRELHAAGWDIGCHSATHPYLPALSATQVQAEIAGAKQTLEQQVNVPVRYFAYPKGAYTPAVAAAVQAAGFEAAFSMDDVVLHPGMPLFSLPRIGVDNTHNFSEFQYSWSPTVIALRGFLKRLIL